MISSFQLILVADEQSVLENHTETGLSLALGIISSYLESKLIHTELFDLNQIFGPYIFSTEEIELLSGIYDGRRVIDYVYGENEPEYDRIAELFLKDIPLTCDAIGFSIGADFSMMQIHLGFILASYVKKNTGKTVFLGGNNISYLYIFKDIYHDMLVAALNNLDYIIKGPGESVIYEIIEGINKNSINIDCLPGLMHIKDNNILCNQEKEPQIICPSWDSLDLSKYSYPFMKSAKENENLYYRFPLSLTNKIIEFYRANVKENKLFIPYIFNYNCTYKCAFCTQSDTDRSGFIVGDVHKVVDDIETLSKKYNSNYFYFLNNYFPSSLEFITQFRDELKKRDLEIFWSDCGRVNGLTFEKLQMMYECGCRKLVFGFESASEKILKLVDKKLKLSELVQVMEWCKEIGIWSDLEVIVGLPYEREEEFLDTYNFVKKHSNIINNFWVNEYFVVPNSLIGRNPQNYEIELLKDQYTYDSIMEKNKKIYEKGGYDFTSNARLWGFNETKDSSLREYEQIKSENKNKMERISHLRDPEINKLFDFYNKMLMLRQKK